MKLMDYSPVIVSFCALLLAIFAALASTIKLIKRRRAQQHLYQVLDERLRYLKSKDNPTTEIKNSPHLEKLTLHIVPTLEKLDKSFYDDVELHILGYLDTLRPSDQKLILDDLYQPKQKGREEFISKLIQQGRFDSSLSKKFAQLLTLARG